MEAFQDTLLQGIIGSPEEGVLVLWVKYTRLVSDETNAMLATNSKSTK